MTERINFQNHCIIPTKYGDFDFHLFTQEIDGITKEHLALVMGEVRDKVNVLVRIHSECCTGDIFGCQRCDLSRPTTPCIKFNQKKRFGCISLSKARR